MNKERLEALKVQKTVYIVYKLYFKRVIVQWDNLLNFMPSSVFYGQRPSVWWTKKHDADLLRGTYKFGYANYHLMKNHPEYSFNELEKSKCFVKKEKRG